MRPVTVVCAFAIACIAIGAAAIGVAINYARQS